MQLGQQPVEIGMQRLGGEGCGGGRRGQQVAVVGQHLQVRPVQRVCAVADQGEQPAAVQPGRHGRADPGQLGRRRTLDPDQDQAAGGTALQLPQHEPARLRAPGRQERRHVGTQVDRAERQGRHPRRHQHGEQQPQATQAGHHGTGVMVSVSVSPLGETVSMVRSSLPPARSTCLMVLASAGSRGRSAMRQSAAVPLPDTS